MPLVIARTPLRVSFFGGGSDLPFFYQREGGCVLTSALEKFTYVIIKDRFDDLVYANWMKKEIVDDVGALEHDLIRESLRLMGITRGVEVTTLADVPATGTGLGSSSSITVGLLLASSVLRGSARTPEELARLACNIEIDLLGKPIGKQDQYIAALGGMLLLHFDRDESVRVEQVGISAPIVRALEERIMLFFTGTTRESAPLLDAVRQNADAKREDLRRLRDMALEGAAALRASDWASFGELLDESWQRKRVLATGVTTPEIDQLYRRARAAGAAGGKITGAGGGGFLVLLVAPEKRDAVRAAVGPLREVPFRIAQHGASVVYFDANVA